MGRHVSLAVCSLGPRLQGTFQPMWTPTEGSVPSQKQEVKNLATCHSSLQLTACGLVSAQAPGPQKMVFAGNRSSCLKGFYIKWPGCCLKKAMLSWICISSIKLYTEVAKSLPWGCCFGSGNTMGLRGAEKHLNMLILSPTLGLLPHHLVCVHYSKCFYRHWSHRDDSNFSADSSLLTLMVMVYRVMYQTIAKS